MRGGVHGGGVVAKWKEHAEEQTGVGGVPSKTDLPGNVYADQEGSGVVPSWVKVEN